MENLNEKLLPGADIGSHFSNGKWGVGCTYKKFRLNNNGMKLIAMNNEGLTELHFDCENKTVAAVITQSTRSLYKPARLHPSNHKILPRHFQGESISNWAHPFRSVFAVVDLKQDFITTNIGSITVGGLNDFSNLMKSHKCSF